MATPAASSEAELIRLPEDRRAIDVSMSRLTLEAEAAALRAALLVAIASAMPTPPGLKDSAMTSGLKLSTKALCTVHQPVCTFRQTSPAPCRRLFASQSHRAEKYL
ncbi:hypothetical protein N9C56_01015 [Paracoccaceae bacterium]|nr:hypothetical protein [Paracoccaceae bacterium]